jgi:hypothetical protein
MSGPNGVARGFARPFVSINAKKKALGCLMPTTRARDDALDE